MTQATQTPVTEVTADELVGGAPSAPPIESQTPVAETLPTPPPVETVNPFPDARDSLNRLFHPAKFRVKDGKPQIDALGRFVPEGLGKKKTGASAASTVPNDAPKSTATPATDAAAPRAQSFIPPDPTPNEVSSALSAEVAVEVAINLVQTALIMIGKDEGVLDETEKLLLRAPLVRCLQKYNLAKKAMTPELELASVLAVLLMKRLKKPNTQNWFQSRLASVRGWWIRRKLGKQVGATAPISPKAGPEAAAAYLEKHGSN